MVKASQKRPLVGLGRVKVRDNRGNFRLARLLLMQFYNKDTASTLLVVWTISQKTDSSPESDLSHNNLLN